MTWVTGVMVNLNGVFIGLPTDSHTWRSQIQADSVTFTGVLNSKKITNMIAKQKMHNCISLFPTHTY